MARTDWWARWVTSKPHSSLSFGKGLQDIPFATIVMINVEPCKTSLYAKGCEELRRFPRTNEGRERKDAGAALTRKIVRGETGSRSLWLCVQSLATPPNLFFTHCCPYLKITSPPQAIRGNHPARSITFFNLSKRQANQTWKLQGRNTS